MECTFGVTLDSILKRPVWAMSLIGAEEPKDSSDSDEGEEDEDGDGDDDDESDGDDKDKKSKGKKQGEPEDPKDHKISNLQATVTRNVESRKKAQADLAKANERIAELEKNGTKDEDLKASLAEMTEKVTTTETDNRGLRLRVAFLEDNTHAWVDPSAALKLVNLKDVDIDDDGNVTGMEDALEDLATKSPYLLKTAEEPKTPKKTPRKTGDAPEGTKDKGDTAAAATKQKLLNKYPGLRR